MTHAVFNDEDFCTGFPGNGLNYQDCKAASDKVPVTQPGDIPETSIIRSRLFSNEPNTEARFKLPQTFTSGRCIIEVNMAKGATFAVTTWDYQQAAVKTILNYCVQPHSIGGRVVQKATIIEVRKKTNKLRPKPAAVVSQCAAISEQRPLYKCLKDADDAAQAANRALQDFSDRIDGLTYQIHARIDNTRKRNGYNNPFVPSTIPTHGTNRTMSGYTSLMLRAFQCS